MASCQVNDIILEKLKLKNNIKFEKSIHWEIGPFDHFTRWPEAILPSTIKAIDRLKLNENVPQPILLLVMV